MQVEKYTVTNSATRMGTVYLLDDDDLEGLILARALESVNCEVVSFCEPDCFLSEFDSERANCVVMDYRLPQLNGLEVLRNLRSRGVFTPFLIVTGYASVSMAVSSMRAGAVTVLEKPVMPSILFDAVQTAISFDLAYRERNSARAQTIARLELLSKREREVLQLVLDGKTTKEVAKILQIASKTVDVHRSHIVQKLGVQSFAEVLRNLYCSPAGPGANEELKVVMQRLSAG